MAKLFREWAKLKRTIHHTYKDDIMFKEREIWWCSIGTNVGFEIDGKGRLVNRPVLIITKFSHAMFFAIPLTNNIKEGSWYVSFWHKGVQSCAVLSQARTYHKNRLNNRLGTIAEQEFATIKDRFHQLIFEKTPKDDGAPPTRTSEEHTQL